MKPLAHMIALASCVLGCGRFVDTSEYSHACERDEDCVAVTAGDLCDNCNCADDAIAVSELARYEADTSGTCVPNPLQVDECLCRIPPPPICSDGLCMLVRE
jgi:hypothetical protein